MTSRTQEQSGQWKQCKPLDAIHLVRPGNSLIRGGAHQPAEGSPGDSRPCHRQTRIGRNIRCLPMRLHVYGTAAETKSSYDDEGRCWIERLPWGAYRGIASAIAPALLHRGATWRMRRMVGPPGYSIMTLRLDCNGSAMPRNLSVIVNIGYPARHGGLTEGRSVRYTKTPRDHVSRQSRSIYISFQTCRAWHCWILHMWKAVSRDAYFKRAVLL